MPATTSIYPKSTSEEEARFVTTLASMSTVTTRARDMMALLTLHACLLFGVSAAARNETVHCRVSQDYVAAQSLGQVKYMAVLEGVVT